MSPLLDVHMREGVMAEARDEACGEKASTASCSTCPGEF